MSKATLMKKLARLESVNDQLVTELEDLDRLMKVIGFTYGIATVKATAHEIIKRGYHEGKNLSDLSDFE